ncbi:endonuclease I [uncultured Caudovirales phage]|uniref:Endonuclease I n=1 Tax=uncultured Caudovirales phage TaxID=2100421 RepID=A0A6J5P0Y1_9CAUD|nr:endonuclease I [uncultured Caudovirales phage]
MKQRRSSRWGIRIEDAELGHHYRSGLEAAIAADLKAQRVPFKFEARVIKYDVPAREAKYTPDFELPNGIIVEGKGEFDTKDRQKHLLVKDQHPTLDIRFVFSNPNSRISKQSATTYAMWCAKHGFQYAAKLIPVGWAREPRRA